MHSTPRPHARPGWAAAALLLAALLPACSLGAAPTATPVAPVPPTIAPATAAPPAPTATTAPAPPTATAVPAPPTDTAVAQAPPTATAVAQVPPTATAPSGPPSASPPATTPAPSGRTGLAFAAYVVTATQVSPAVPAYTVAPDLSNVKNAGQFTFSAEQRAALAQNAFVVVPPRNVQLSDIQPVYRQFYQLYEDGRYAEQPAFVTTNSVLHVYHLMFDKLLRTTETQYLIADAQALTSAMLQASQAQLAAAQGTPLETAAHRNVAYFAVAARLLDPQAAIPPAVASDVQAELALIAAHAGIQPSHIFADYQQDYSQFVPRGHYTRTPALSQYFQAMMWYGQMTFRLNSPDETRSALLLASALQAGGSGPHAPATLWDQIYEPTAFFVGTADDLTYRDYWPLITQVYGASPAPAAFADDAKLAQFEEAAKALAAPRINSMFVYIWEDKTQVTKGLRFMGQRFTVDEYVLGQLLYRNVGTLDDPRMLPKALDVPAAMGSDTALQILTQEGETHYANYTTQMTKVRGELSSLPQSQWTENLYWSWLYTFFPILHPAPGAGYPAFMQSDAWATKELNTVTGSWTELKHDTLLYAKQVMAEAGGGPPQQIKGYVEPYPEFYGRIAALIGMTQDGLSKRGLLDPTLAEPLATLHTLALTLQTISVKELQNQPLTSDEYDTIQYYGATIEHLTIAAADINNVTGRVYLEDQDSALAADVASSPYNQVLEEAVGHPTAIYVVVPVDGTLVLARGGVYSHYEFTVAAADRLTDDAWKAQLNANQAPALPAWTSVFLKP